ncbi:VOC family protein [Planococcus dechangensis]|uniref:VOC family protein n=1 Tax=Planococcus dechangensis TaxID=1176255 RepID=A0ABV9M8A6_9BACL
MKLDHIVHFTKQSPLKSSEYWNAAGFHAVVGGSHKNWGTHNALMYGPDYYIEWLTSEDEELAARSSHPLVEHLRYDQQGFGTICLRSDNLELLSKQLESRGFRTIGPTDAERQTETGELIRWKMLFIDQEISMALPLPFFIEWEQEDKGRFAALKSNGTIQAVNEQLQLDTLFFSVNDKEQSETQWKKLLGGSLELGNCRLSFEEGEGKERLSKVCFASAERELLFEHGLYQVPRFE